MDSRAVVVRLLERTADLNLRRSQLGRIRRQREFAARAAAFGLSRAQLLAERPCIRVHAGGVEVFAVDVGRGENGHFARLVDVVMRVRLLGMPEAEDALAACLGDRPHLLARDARELVEGIRLEPEPMQDYEHVLLRSLISLRRIVVCPRRRRWC